MKPEIIKKIAEDNSDAIDRLIKQSKLSRARLFIALPEVALSDIVIRNAANYKAFTPQMINFLKAVMGESIAMYKAEREEAEMIINDNYIETEMFKQTNN